MPPNRQLQDVTGKRTTHQGPNLESPWHWVIPEPIVRVTAQAAVNAIMSLSAARQFDDLLRATRILAIATCPDPKRHRSVAIYCLVPLETFVLSTSTKQELTRALPRGWMSSG
jgi:hypothetical protein